MPLDKKKSPEKSEPIFSDFVNIIKQNTKEARADHQTLTLRFDRLEEKLAANDERVSNVEKSIDVIHVHRNEMDQQVVNSKVYDQLTTVCAVVDLLKETVKHLQINAVTLHVNVPVNQKSLLPLSIRPPSREMIFDH